MFEYMRVIRVSFQYSIVLTRAIALTLFFLLFLLGCWIAPGTFCYHQQKIFQNFPKTFSCFKIFSSLKVFIFSGKSCQLCANKMSLYLARRNFCKNWYFSNEKDQVRISLREEIQKGKRLGANVINLHKPVFRKKLERFI